MMSLICSPWGWLVVFVILLVFEMLTQGLTTIWFAGGAAAAFISAVMHASETVQLILFFAVSLILLLFTRPAAVKFMKKEKEKTNVDSLVDSQGIVTEEINNEKETGEVRVGGMVWMARSTKQQIIEKDTPVRICAVQGVKLMVEK